MATSYRLPGGKDPLAVFLGQKLRVMRTARKMTVVEAAAAIGIHPSTYATYEQGTAMMSCRRLYEAASVLEIPVGYFFDGLPDFKDLDKPFEMAHEHFDYLTAQGREAWILMRSILAIQDDTLKHQLIGLVHRLVTNNN